MLLCCLGGLRRQVWAWAVRHQHDRLAVQNRASREIYWPVQNCQSFDMTQEAGEFPGLGGYER